MCEFFNWRSICLALGSCTLGDLVDIDEHGSWKMDCEGLRALVGRGAAQQQLLELRKFAITTLEVGVSLVLSSSFSFLLSCFSDAHATGIPLFLPQCTSDRLPSFSPLVHN